MLSGQQPVVYDLNNGFVWYLQRQNTPPSWDQSDDPCGAPWVGVTCTDSRITALAVLSSSSSSGVIKHEPRRVSKQSYWSTTELRSLELSYNPNVTGPLTPRLGDLPNLKILILAGCGFSGSIPDELGNLAELSFLALNSNILSGTIPASLGKLYWLDLAENQLTGTIPICKNYSPGLDLLLNAKHFFKASFDLNFSAQYDADIRVTVLFDGNRLEGEIPSTLGLVQTLEVLNLANNELTGPLPVLTKMDSLNYGDLCNIYFDSSEASGWFPTLPSLTTLVIENGSVQGT
ncbi:hypothetical protein SADUNF_Sadunf08G0102100 [Salix dunnii]|uniref:Leucine-rich repeat-containing N-terminal plant-type domain-containing protein n=1 Tax=Salix dunnii TaxID=1413687 RepID=A0A835JTT3_9ROSI|nr:hypothetical protein SADUNF_Sadunf08G0102100 [Salix dunnii]